MHRYNVALSAILLLITFDISSAQRTVRNMRVERPTVLQTIRSQLRAGTISTEDAIKLQFRASFAPDKLPAKYQKEGRFTGKCLTPAIELYHSKKRELSPSLRQEVEGYLQSTNSYPDSLDSPNGLFRLYYTTNGADSVSVIDEDNDGVPDYVEKAAQFAETAWQKEVQEIGYKDPLTDQKPYHIYFENQNTYGYTTTQDSGPRKTDIYIHPTFDGDFPTNDDPEGKAIGALKVTLAHELKHAINYLYYQFSTPVYSDTYDWTEMDATIMEEVVFDEVNDYYNYIITQWSIFSQPYNSFYPGSYDHVSWGLYFTQRYGNDFWLDVWSYIGQVDNHTYYLPAIRRVLNQRGGHYLAEFTRSMLWHLASGKNQPDGYGFEEAANYPDPTVPRDFKWPNGEADTSMTFDWSHVPAGPIDSPSKVDSLSAHFIRIRPDSNDYGQIQVVLEHSQDTVGLGLLVYPKTGDRREYIYTGDHSGRIAQGLSMNWQDIDELRLVVANPLHQSNGFDYTIEFGTREHKLEVPVEKEGPAIPQHLTLEQNYPNPFNPSTTIAFELPEPGTVRLQLYDRAGRLVRTMVNKNMSTGRHTINLDADNLASGLYLYRLQYNGQVLTRKMTLLK